MSERKVRFSLCFSFALVVLAGVSSAGASAAWSGDITRAAANENRVSASIAGMIEWTGCEHWVTRGPREDSYESPHCGWLAYATLGPGSESSDCETHDRDLAHLGGEVTLIWQGEEEVRYERDFLGFATFDKTSVPLSGSNRLVCLSIIEAAPEYALTFCPAQIGFPCPWFETLKFQHEVASALLATLDFEDPESEPEPGGDEAPESRPSAGEGSSLSASPGTQGSAGATPAPPALPHVRTKRRSRCQSGKRQRTARHRRCRHSSHVANHLTEARARDPAHAARAFTSA